MQDTARHDPRSPRRIPDAPCKLSRTVSSGMVRYVIGPRMPDSLHGGALPVVVLFGQHGPHMQPVAYQCARLECVPPSLRQATTWIFPPFPPTFLSSFSPSLSLFLFLPFSLAFSFSVFSSISLFFSFSFLSYFFSLFFSSFLSSHFFFTHPRLQLDLFFRFVRLLLWCTPSVYESKREKKRIRGRKLRYLRLKSILTSCDARPRFTVDSRGCRRHRGNKNVRSRSTAHQRTRISRIPPR